MSDDGEPERYDGTSLDKCIEQLTKEKMIGPILDIMRIMGEKGMALFPEFWLPVFELILREGTEEDYGRFSSALAAIHAKYELLAPVFIETEVALEVITARGVHWLPRILETVNLESRSRLWGSAIRDDFPQLEELNEILQSTKDFFMYEIEASVKLIAGREGSVERLERWVPHALDPHFLNAGEDYWSTFMCIALGANDEPLAEALLQRDRTSQILPFLFVYWNMKTRAGVGRILLLALDKVSDSIRETRMADDTSLARLARKYRRGCRIHKQEADPDILAHLVKTGSKGAME